MIRRRRPSFSLVTKVLLALSLVMLSFGHKPVAAAGSDLSAYAMPDGTLPELCLPGTTDRNRGHDGCPACVLAKAVLTVDPAPPVARPFSPAMVVLWPAGAASTTFGRTARAPPARGPPGILMI